MMATRAAEPTDATEVLDVAALEAAASAVPDPELPVVTLGDLGIVRGVSIAADGTVEVRLTPTFVGCPATEAIAADVRAAVAARLAEDGAPHVGVRTRMTMSPAWSTDWISADGRRKLAEHGIAPPRAGARGDGPVLVQISPSSPSFSPRPPAQQIQISSHTPAQGQAQPQPAAQPKARSEPAAQPEARPQPGAQLQPPVQTPQLGAPGQPPLQGRPLPGAQPPPQPCPHCGSSDTRELSAFGSTPCQSLRACRVCGEPFGAMKSL